MAEYSGEFARPELLSNEDGDKMARVEHHNDATRMLIARLVMDECVGGHPADPDYEASLAVLVKEARAEWFAQHRDDPTEADGCYCEEAGWWCNEIDGERSAFWYFDHDAIHAAEEAGATVHSGSSAQGGDGA